VCPHRFPLAASKEHGAGRQWQERGARRAYAETKEQLAGYYMIDVPDLGAALSWAARCPGTATGPISLKMISR
jgi:hypothetical protein